MPYGAFCWHVPASDTMDLSEKDPVSLPRQNELASVVMPEQISWNLKAREITRTICTVCQLWVNFTYHCLIVDKPPLMDR